MASMGKFFLVLLCSAALMEQAAMAAGDECGNMSAQEAAYKMLPCAEASQDPNAAVSAKCCAAAAEVTSNPACLCALIKIGESMKAFNPEAALTIPKRCNFHLKYSGYKCGSYTLP